MQERLSALSPRDRVPYEPIVGRKPFVLPNQARVAVWTIVNVENWLPDSAMPRSVLAPPMGQPLLPDLPNWCWHEYGMRVGFWRFLEVLSSRKLRATFAVNGSACTEYPQACQAALAAGWEFMGMGWCKNRCTAWKTGSGHQADHRSDCQLHRQNPARLGKSGADRNARHHRFAGRGRH